MVNDDHGEAVVVDAAQLEQADGAITIFSGHVFDLVCVGEVEVDLGLDCRGDGQHDRGVLCVKDAKQFGECDRSFRGAAGGLRGNAVDQVVDGDLEGLCQPDQAGNRRGVLAAFPLGDRRSRNAEQVTEFFLA